MPEWVEIVIRSFSLFFGLFILTKLLGKKQVSNLSFFEFIVGITAGSLIASLSLTSNIGVGSGIISLLIWLLLPFLMSIIAIYSKSIRDFFYGNATVFIKDGKIMEDNLKKEKVNTDQLLSQLRTKNVFNLADVEFAVMEPGGDINVLLKKDNQPMTPKDFGMNLAPTKEPQTVIMDGVIMDEPLATMGLSRGWLKEQLDIDGLALENIFLAQVDQHGQLNVDVYDDKIQVPQPTQKPLLLASLKKCQADLELFALGTDSKQAKAMYQKNAKRMNEILEKSKQYLQN